MFPSFEGTSNSLFPYEHMGLERCILMSQMGHNEHGRPQLPRCPVIIMHPCTSCGIFICTRHDTYLIKRLQSKVPAWQQMSREFLTKRSAFSASPSCDSSNATHPGKTDWQPSSCDPTPSNAVALPRSSPLQSADVYSYSQWTEELINGSKWGTSTSARLRLFFHYWMSNFSSYQSGGGSC